MQIARNFLSGKGLVSSSETVAYRPPLYPLFLAGVYFLFGEGYWPIRIVQSVLGGLSCVMVYYLGEMVLNRRTAKIASGICGIYPFFIFFTGFELTEILFILLLIGGVLLWLRLKDSLTIKESAFSGIVNGLIVLCRPSALLFILFASVVFLFLWWRRNWWKVGILIIFTILTILPWSVRNFYHFKRFVPLTTMTGLSFWEGNNPHATGGLCQYWPEEIKNMSEVDRDRYLTKATLRVIVENPSRFFKLLGIKFVRFWNIVPNYKGFSSFLYNMVSLLSYPPVIITGIYGMFLTKRKWRRFLVFYLSFFSFTLIHMIFVGSIRYRVPVMPFMIIFSSYTLSWMWEKVSHSPRFSLG